MVCILLYTQCDFNSEIAVEEEIIHLAFKKNQQSCKGTEKKM